MGVVGQIYVHWHLRNFVFTLSDYKVESYWVSKGSYDEYENLLESAFDNASL